MTKKLKKSIIGALAAVVILCAGLLLFPGAGMRDTYADGESEDFAFTPGAYSSYALLYDENDHFTRWAMGFELKKLTTKFESLSTAPGGFWWWDDTPYFNYTFTFYRKDANENVKLYSYAIKLSGDKDDSEYSVRIEKNKPVYYTEELFFASGRHDDSGSIILERLNNATFSTEKMPDGTVKYVQETKVKASTLGGKVNLPFDKNNSFMVIIVPNNDYSEYFVTLDYDLFMWSSDSAGRDKVKAVGTCQSSVRSLYTVFKNMEDAGALRSEISDEDAYSYAYDTIHKKVEKTVVLTYLTQIPGTPFATPKTQQATVTVRKDDPKLPADEAARVLGVKNFDCLGSYCEGFEPGESSAAYTAKYYKNVWLKARTVDGNDYDYFLDINKSYAEFYQYFVDKGIFDRGAYETVFSSQIYANYADKLSGHSPASIYGFFGFAIIPKTYGVNTLWKEFFNTKTSQSGVISTFEYGVNLSLSAYNQLLEDYNYRFLSRVWNSTANFFTSGAEDATCYILYAEPGTKSSFVAENGADDIHDGTGTAKKPLQEVGDFIGSIGGALGDGLSGISAWIKGLSGRAKTISFVVILALCGAVAVFIASKSAKSKK